MTNESNAESIVERYANARPEVNSILGRWQALMVAADQAVSDLSVDGLRVPLSDLCIEMELHAHMAIFDPDMWQLLLLIRHFVVATLTVICPPEYVEGMRRGHLQSLQSQRVVRRMAPPRRLMHQPHPQQVLQVQQPRLEQIELNDEVFRAAAYGLRARKHRPQYYRDDEVDMEQIDMPATVPTKKQNNSQKRALPLVAAKAKIEKKSKGKKKEEKGEKGEDGKKDGCSSNGRPIAL